MKKFKEEFYGLKYCVKEFPWTKIPAIQDAFDKSKINRNYSLTFEPDPKSTSSKVILYGEDEDEMKEFFWTIDDKAEEESKYDTLKVEILVKLK